MSAAETEQPWYVESFNELNNLYGPEGLPDPKWIEGDWPDWVANVAKEVLAAFFPVAHLKEKLTPRVLGAFIGHQIAGFESLAENPPSAKQAGSIRVLIAPAGGFPESYANDFAAFIDGTSLAIKRTIERALDANPKERIEFFEAFTKSLKAPIAAGSRPNTLLLFVLLVAWRELVTLPSITAVHQELAKSMPANVLGNLKRFEKICQRMGWKMRNRGRPKGKREPAKFRQPKT